MKTKICLGKSTKLSKAAVALCISPRHPAGVFFFFLNKNVILVIQLGDLKQAGIYEVCSFNTYTLDKQ